MIKKKQTFERASRKILKELLTSVLKNPRLRKRAGMKLPTSGDVAISCDVEFVSGSVMKKLNGKFRNKNEPTVILSFPAHKIFQAHGHLGDLVICVPVVEKQSKEYGHGYQEELEVLLAHGVLHLLHFDQENGGKEALQMKKEEASLLGTHGLIHRGSAAAPRSFAQSGVAPRKSKAPRRK